MSRTELLSYNDFGVPKRCFSFGRGSNVASVPEPRHFILALIGLWVSQRITKTAEVEIAIDKIYL